MERALTDAAAEHALLVEPVQSDGRTHNLRSGHVMIDAAQTVEPQQHPLCRAVIGVRFEQ